MKVYFTSPISALKTQMPYIRKIREILLDEGYYLTRDWLPEYIDPKKNKLETLLKDSTKRSVWYKEIKSAIMDADVCIFESTKQTMGLGHQVTLALEKNKPTLIIGDRKNGGIMENLLIAGSGSGYLTLKNYSDIGEMEKQITKFLEKNKNKRVQRLNIALDSNLFSKINEQSKKINTTKTDIIRKALKDYFKME